MAEGELQRDVLRLDPREGATRVRRVRAAVRRQIGVTAQMYVTH